MAMQCYCRIHSNLEFIFGYYASELIRLRNANLNVFDLIVCPFSLDIDCDNTANRIPGPVAEDFSQVI
jgi:hypothetical protein